MRHEADALKHLRIWLSFFIAGLVLSGFTAFPLERELSTLLVKVDASECCTGPPFSYGYIRLATHWP